MSVIPATGSALHSLLATNGTVSVYQAVIPDDASLPCIVWDRGADEDRYGFSHDENAAEYQIKVVDDAEWPGRAQQIYGNHLHGIVQGASLSVSGFTTVEVRRSSTLDYRDPDGFWHVGGLYRIWLAT